MKNWGVRAAIALIASTSLVVILNGCALRPKFGIRNSSPLGPMGGPVPLTPSQAAAFTKWVLLEKAAKSAKSKGNWAGAEASYRAETLMPYCLFKQEVWVELGLMQDYQGKREEAFKAYQKGFGIGSHRGPAVGGSPEIAEAAARCGLMCEDRELHADACECYYTARRSENVNVALPMTLDANHTSSTEVRKLLGSVLRGAQTQDKITRGPI